MKIINAGSGEVDVQLTKEEGSAFVSYLQVKAPRDAERLRAKLRDTGEVNVPDAIERVRRFLNPNQRALGVPGCASASL